MARTLLFTTIILCHYSTNMIWENRWMNKWLCANNILSILSSMLLCWTPRSACGGIEKTGIVCPISHRNDKMDLYWEIGRLTVGFLPLFLQVQKKGSKMSKHGKHIPNHVKYRTSALYLLLFFSFLNINYIPKANHHGQFSYLTTY